jgi:hypothetical protein
MYTNDASKLPAPWPLSPLFQLPQLPSPLLQLSPLVSLDLSSFHITRADIPKLQVPSQPQLFPLSRLLRLQLFPLSPPLRLPSFLLPPPARQRARAQRLEMLIRSSLMRRRRIRWL